MERRNTLVRDRHSLQPSIWQQLTLAEMEKCWQKFSSSKAASNDFITVCELQRMLKEMGREVSDEETRAMMSEADPASDSTLSYAAFVRAIEQCKASKYEESMNFIGLTYDFML